MQKHFHIETKKSKGEMKKMKETKKKENVLTKARKMVGMLLLAMAMVNVTALTLAPTTEVSAAPTPTPSSDLTLTGGEDDFGNMMNFVLGWVTKAGIAVLLIGAVEFAFGWYSQNPDAKMTGIRIMIAGAIVSAVGVAGQAVNW